MHSDILIGINITYMQNQFTSISQQENTWARNDCKGLPAVVTYSRYKTLMETRQKPEQRKTRHHKKSSRKVKAKSKLFERCRKALPP